MRAQQDQIFILSEQSYTTDSYREGGGVLPNEQRESKGLVPSKVSRGM